MKNTNAKKIILILACVILALVVIAFFVPQVFPLLGMALKRVLQVFSIVFIERWFVWLIILGVFVAVFSFIYFVVPILKFFFGRCFAYTSIKRICKRQKLAVSFPRRIFSSLKGPSEKEDIQIVLDDETYYIHFVDVLFGFRRELLFTKEKQYYIARTNPSKWSAYGATLIDGKSYFDLSAKVISDHATNSSKQKSIPPFLEAGKHIAVVHSVPSEVYILDGSKAEPAYNGSVIGEDLAYYTVSGLKKLLKEHH